MGLTHCGAPQNSLETNTTTKQGTAVTAPTPSAPAPQQPQQPTAPTTPSTSKTFSKCTKDFDALSGTSMAQPEVSCAQTASDPCPLTVKFSISPYTFLEYEIDVPSGNSSNNSAHQAPRALVTGTTNPQQPTIVTQSGIGYFPFFVKLRVYRDGSYPAGGNLPNERIEYTCTP